MALVATRRALLSQPKWWFSGAAVDMDFVGNRYFGGAQSSLLAFTRASIGNALTSTGLLMSFGNNVLRITDLGLWVEQAATNVVLWNRDLTNAAWTPSNVTAALDQVGIDGVTNSASSIVSTAGNGTILQAITLGSSARFQSVFMKRITGVGNIDMTMDGGTTWTTVSGSINSSTYTRVTIPTQTLANPSVGFRIVTSGDKVAVDFVQNETLLAAGEAQGSSPIATTTVSVTRAADSILTAGALQTRLASATGSCFAQGGQLPAPTGFFAGCASTTDGFLTASSVTTVRLKANNILTAATLGGSKNWTTSSGIKAASAWDPSGNSVVGANGTVATNANILTPTATSYVGSQNAAAFLNGPIMRLAVWATRLSDTALKNLTV